MRRESYVAQMVFSTKCGWCLRSLREVWNKADIRLWTPTLCAVVWGGADTHKGWAHVPHDSTNDVLWQGCSGTVLQFIESFRRTEVLLVFRTGGRPIIIAFVCTASCCRTKISNQLITSIVDAISTSITFTGLNVTYNRVTFAKSSRSVQQSSSLLLLW